MWDLNWQRVCLNLRREISLAEAARLISKRSGLRVDKQRLSALARGEVKEPKFRLALELLNLHHELCPGRHSPDWIVDGDLPL